MLADTLAQPLFSFFLLSLQKERARVDEMITHVALGISRIPQPNRFEDRLVEGQRMITVDQLRSQHHHVDQRTMNHLKEPAKKPVAGTLQDGPVKQQVSFNDAELIFPRRFDLRDRLPQYEQLLRSGPLRRPGGERRLNNQPRLNQLL